MHFVEQNLNFNKNETELKIENPTHSFTRDEPFAAAHIRMAN